MPELIVEMGLGRPFADVVRDSNTSTGLQTHMLNMYYKDNFTSVMAACFLSLPQRGLYAVRSFILVCGPTTALTAVTDISNLYGHFGQVFEIL